MIVKSLEVPAGVPSALLSHTLACAFKSPRELARLTACRASSASAAAPPPFPRAAPPQHRKMVHFYLFVALLAVLHADTGVFAASGALAYSFSPACNAFIACPVAALAVARGAATAPPSHALSPHGGAAFAAVKAPPPALAWSPWQTHAVTARVFTGALYFSAPALLLLQFVAVLTTALQLLRSAARRVRASFLLLLLLLLPLRTAAQSPVCTSAFAKTDYGVFPVEGVQAFCTNVPGSTYANNALQLSRHQAPPGYRLVLTISAWNLEVDFDFAMVYAAPADAVVATFANCALTNISNTLTIGPIPATFGPYYSGYGAQQGLCFYSDSDNMGGGITYTLTTEACPAGSFCATGANASAPCLDGTFSAAGSTSCMAVCPSGMYASNASSCFFCEAGTYSATGASSCTSCAVNSFSAVGASTCAATCPAGMYASAYASCLTCPAGSFSLSGAFSCTACAPGTYQPQSGMTFCIPCVAGTFQAAFGGAEPCTPCAAGTFNAQAGQHFCVPCASGTFSTPGSLTCMHTVCPAGTFALPPAACLFCDAGSYNENAGQLECTPCAAGLFSPVIGASSSDVCILCTGVRPPLSLPFFPFRKP